MTTWENADFNPDDFANLRHIGPSKAEMQQVCDRYIRSFEEMA